MSASATGRTRTGMAMRYLRQIRGQLSLLSRALVTSILVQLLAFALPLLIGSLTACCHAATSTCSACSPRARPEGVVPEA